MYRLLALVAMTAAMLAACGGDAGDEGTAPRTGQEGEGAFPTTVEHQFGTAEIPQDPQRIVSVGFNDADFALAFGMTPVGTRALQDDYQFQQRPWAQQALGRADPEVVGAAELNFEQIAALQPDLILGIYSGMTEREYELLSQIAPTVAQTDDFVDFGLPWQQQTQLTGRALGREEQARELVTRLEERFAQAREEHPELEGLSLALASPAEDGYFAFSAEDLRTRFFTSLGFTVPQEIEELAGEAFFAELSGERVDLLDQDVLIMFATPEDLEDDALFQRLDAVREGRVIYLPTGGDNDLYGALNYNSPLSLPFQIDGFVPLLEAAADGDPATAVPPIG